MNALHDFVKEENQAIGRFGECHMSSSNKKNHTFCTNRYALVAWQTVSKSVCRSPNATPREGCLLALQFLVLAVRVRTRKQRM